MNFKKLIILGTTAIILALILGWTINNIHFFMGLLLVPFILPNVVLATKVIEDNWKKRFYIFLGFGLVSIFILTYSFGPSTNWRRSGLIFLGIVIGNLSYKRLEDFLLLKVWNKTSPPR